MIHGAVDLSPIYGQTRVVELIYWQRLIGSGTQDDPYRSLTILSMLDGTELVSWDHCTETVAKIEAAE